MRNFGVPVSLSFTLAGLSFSDTGFICVTEAETPCGRDRFRTLRNKGVNGGFLARGFSIGVWLMSLSQSISAVLPGMRRYARALTGNQHAGDGLITAVLEGLIADPSVPAGMPVKVGLYRLFLQRYNQQGSAHEAAEQGTETAADRRLAQLSPAPRQAYLLRALEGFSVEDAANALGVDTQVIGSLVAQANQEMMGQVATDVLIIEDEPMIALDLKEIMISLGHNVTAVARTHREAVAAIEAKPVGLVLADIQLADGSSGIEAVNDILGISGVPIVFITAYPERLLTGERPEPTFLITKPFAPENVKAITSQALFFDLKARPRRDGGESRPVLGA
jgi:CheY-like chemotaxis protein/DNA-directed RNA polymerase specialized sigma24 family protein